MLGLVFLEDLFYVWVFISGMEVGGVFGLGVVEGEDYPYPLVAR